MTKFIAAIALLAASTAVTAEAATGIPFEARCTVRVDGKTYLHHRKCEVYFYANVADLLTCGDANGVAACVKCDKNGACEGSWGDGPIRKADRPLGQVKRFGKTDICWSKQTDAGLFPKHESVPRRELREEEVIKKLSDEEQ